jgi:hypothetical protein
METPMSTDIRIEAWNLGRTNTAAECYTRLERGDTVAERVFAAMRRNEWGVEAAWKDGLRGVNIETTDSRTGITTARTGRRAPMPVRRTVNVAANGGSI